MGKLRIVFHNKHITKLRLFHGKVGAGVLQFRGKRNGAVTGDGVEILTQVVGEIHRDLPGFLRIEHTKAVDAHQGIINKMRPHLQNHDAGALIGDFPLLLSDFPLLLGEFLLLAAILFNLVGQDESVHSKCREGIADVKERCGIDKQHHDQRGYHRQLGDNEADRGFMGHLRPASQRA